MATEKQVNNKKIGVGIIGASPLTPDSWAVNAHIPAIKALPEDYELRAVSTSHREEVQQKQLKKNLECRF